MSAAGIELRAWLIVMATGTLAVATDAAPGPAPPADTWRAPSLRAVLRNDALTAHFQSGFLVELKGRRTGTLLVSVPPDRLPARPELFGTAYGELLDIDLDACAVTQQIDGDALTVRFESPEGAAWRLQWFIEPGAGDLILHAAARLPQPVVQFRLAFGGCDISAHRLVRVNQLGVGEQAHGPWKGTWGDPVKGGFSTSQVHPLVALFEGGEAGWFLEGRDVEIGPANLVVRGHGETVEISLIHVFAEPTNVPEMFEIRLRAYDGHWADAADPYIRWMEEAVGFVPLERKQPAWVREIRNQAYVRCHDLEGLEHLAARVDPAQTFVGRVVGWRNHGMGTVVPDYRVNESARRWFRRARELGFHVGAHFAAHGLSPEFPELLERFRPGLRPIGTNEDGEVQYWRLPFPPSTEPVKFYYCSHAYKPWRDYYVEQLRDAVEAGVDVIYLDEAAWPCGNFLVDGVTAIEGVMALERQILDTYPGVAVETEQFNPMASRHAAFALCQMSPGHPLGGYLFHRFVHIVAEGINSQPVDGSSLDAVASWGFMLPSASAEPSWLDIAGAFQDWRLSPDIRLPRFAVPRYLPDGRHGYLPVIPDPPPGETLRLFGYRGAGGVTAAYARQAHKRGLLVEEPDREPRWVGSRVGGVNTWPGPGILIEWIPGVSRTVDWFLYDGGTQLGLEPTKTYRLDEAATFPPDRFHVAGLPADFAFHDPQWTYEPPQDVGRDGSYFRLRFTGHGELTMHVPDDVLVFLDGAAVPIDRAARTAHVTVEATPASPGELLAFPASDTPLEGALTDLPWQTPLLQRSFFVSQHSIHGYGRTGMGRSLRGLNHIYNHVSGRFYLSGRLPQGPSVRLQGAYGAREDSYATTGDAVVRVNGREVLWIPAGPRPYRVHAFDVNLAAFAGQHVLMEFSAQGKVHGFTAADWYNPRIAVRQAAAASAVGSPGPANRWNASRAIQVRASSSHAARTPPRTVDGSGIGGDGLTHAAADFRSMFLTGKLAQSRANPRGGTVEGGHWIEFTFDRAYPLGEMWIWNYGEPVYETLGMKRVTIQYAVTGSPEAADWHTIHEGTVPMTERVLRQSPCLKVDFGGAKARYVVITTADTPDHNWARGAMDEAGLSEVRFHVMPYMLP